jgi:2'-5' RNA ligase
VAVDISPQARADVAAATEPFRERIRGARWAGSEGWHVTLKFLGTTWPRQVDAVRAAVTASAAATSPFETSLTEDGVFPTPRRARVLWIGLSDPEGRMRDLVAALDRALAEDFEPEDREFTPHLTVARLQAPRDLAEFAPDLVGTPVVSPPFPVTELVLYRSHLSPRGATYEPVLRAPFGG